MKIVSIITIILFILSTLALLSIAVKGQIGNPVYYQTEKDTRVGGPFESSNSTSRYALTESIVDDHSLTLTKDLASFSLPDVVSYKGKFFSIFTPGVSFIGVPLYILGKQFGLQQLTTYASVLLFSFLNMFLVAYIARKFGAGLYASLLSGFIFLFATNGFAYGLSFTQHQESVTAILLAFILVLRRRTLLNNIVLGLLVGVSVLLDIPNAIMLLPLVLYVIYKGCKITSTTSKIKLFLQLNIIGLLIGILPFIGLFAWYDFQTTGSYTKIAQFIGRSESFASTQPVHEQHASTRSSLSFPFDTRFQINGMYTLLISDERSWIYYSPIVFIGILGLFLAYKQTDRKTAVVLISSIVLIEIIIYSMFSDPWGGWSFGPRYLIPSAAILCTGIGYALQQFAKNYLFTFIFSVLLIYSLSVNTLGAFTTSAIPPKVEAIHLANPVPYTYQYNIDLMNKSQSSSLAYNMAFIHYTDLRHFLLYFIIALYSISTVLYVLAVFSYRTKKS